MVTNSALLVLGTLAVGVQSRLAPGGFLGDVEAEYFTQEQDHFDAANANTWQQAYFVNDDFWSGDANAPVFLYIGGEGPLTNRSVTNNFVVDFLPETKALLLGVEHRYYGCDLNASSCPYDSTTQNHLQYLSSKQALADLASFHKFATKKFNLAPTNKWVAWGGSYPGMLAGFVRAVYPDLIHASVASSAPVHAKVDMTEFQDTVTEAYGMHVEGVGGSLACMSAIRQAHTDVGLLLASPAGHEVLANLFPSTVPDAAWLANATNQRYFAGCGVASFPAQSNDPLCTTPACGITQICKIMSDDKLTRPIDRLARVLELQSQANMVSTCDMDWEMPGDIPPADVNYWGYQTCTEFGFYQTCEQMSQCFYVKGLVSFRNAHHKPSDFCGYQYGISQHEIEEATKRSNDYYLTAVSKSSRIIWVNGDVDPWHGLGYLDQPGDDQLIIWPVQGARHCAWMNGAKDTDQQSLKTARTKIYDQVRKWLEQ